MEKLDMESKNIINENIIKLTELFPNVVVDGKVDFNALKQELSSDIIDEAKEKYQMTWPGKNEAIKNTASLTTKTLRPVSNFSKSSDNIYIEGDNLDVLKILQESYLNKIKCIYIDPPYNTGNDFIYNDNFDKTKLEELTESGEIDSDGNRLVSNPSSNGRFHSDWLTMIYPRLKLARNLLTQDGVMFISIDDNEIANLIKIGEMIFGEDNVEVMVWDKITGNDNAGSGKMKITYRFRRDHEYVVVCYKDKQNCLFNKPLRLRKTKNEYGNADNDPRGNWISSEICKSEEKSNPNGKNYFTLTTPSGMEITRQWHFSKEELDELIADNRIYFGNGNIIPRLKRFLNEPAEVTPSSILSSIASQTDGNNDLKKYNLEFDNPKPISLIKWLIEIGSNDGDYVLDFFSGSGTTAEAVLQLNAENKGTRKFILVQLPEQIKDGKTICDIGISRINESIKSIKNEHEDFNADFKIFRVDSSNMKEVYYKPNEISQMNLLDYISNIKDERTSEDLLAQVMLDLGLTLDLKIEEKNILNNKVYFVENNSLVACFDDDVDISIVDEICKINPMKVVFKDSSFKTDKDKINLEERIKKLSPDTEVSVL